MNTGEHFLRMPVVTAALAALFVLTSAATGNAPAFSQDFSITNPEQPQTGSRRDVMRQLQAWWDVHGYYPRHASSNDESGTVALHLQINPDGNISAADVATSSGSHSLDTAAAAAFRGGFVRPFPPGAPAAAVDLSLHYVLAHRHDQPVAANYSPNLSKAAFTITNDPASSPILDTMLQRTCTGTVVKEGIRNHPAYGVNYAAQAIFFRRPDGTPWVKFYEGGFPTLAPVTQTGKLVQWSGREEHLKGGIVEYTRYTVWPDGDNSIGGYIDQIYPFHDPDANEALNHGGTADFTCASEIVPAVAWSIWSATPSPSPLGDPP